MRVKADPLVVIARIALKEIRGCRYLGESIYAARVAIRRLRTNIFEESEPYVRFRTHKVLRFFCHQIMEASKDLDRQCHDDAELCLLLIDQAMRKD